MYYELKPLRDTDNLSELSISKLEWDVEINDTPQQLVRIDDKPHGEGGYYGLNEYYVYPLSEKMTTSNLTPYWGYRGGVCWGIHFE